MLHNLPSTILHHIPLCTRHTCVPNQCKQSLFQLAGCAWTPRLRLLHGLVDVGRQASGVVCSNDLTAGLEAHGFLNHVDTLVAHRSFATALDRRVFGRARDGVVILGRGATVLRNRVWAMSAPSCHFGIISPCVMCAVGEPPTASSLSGARVYLWVLTGTHPCDDSPRQGGEPSERPTRVVDC